MILQDWLGVLGDPKRKTDYIRRVRERDAVIGSFLEFDPNRNPRMPAERPLKGLPVAVKDNIAVEGFMLSCGSRILENFVSPYNATVVERLTDAGAVMVGKTNLDEFGMGSSNEHSALRETVNPWDADRVPGGSSGGSAAAVSAGMVPLALGSDTGGSVRQPANFCGIYGLKPTYGALSRYGLTAYASSLEVIGILGRDLDLLKQSFSLMAGEDGRDQSSLPFMESKTDRRRAMMLKVSMDDLEKPVAQSYADAVEALKDSGYKVEEISLPSLEFVVPAYYTIATAEASSNLARYNGIRYGKTPDFAASPDELMRRTRHLGFGDEVKLRILLGTYVLRSGFQDQYYIRAQKVRTRIRRDLTELFNDRDILVMPVFPTQAFLKGEGGMDDYRQRLGDIYTCLANLAGLPALALPTGASNGLPTGVQVMATAFGESALFAVARRLAKSFPMPRPPQFLDFGDAE